MQPSDTIRQLTLETLSALDSGEVKLSTVIRKCIRIARLRSDFYNLLWLEREIIDTTNKYERARVLGEISPHFTKEQFSELNKIFVEMWIKERPVLQLDNDLRPIKTDLIIGKGVGEIEIDLEGWINTYQNAVTPQGMHPFDTAYFDNQNFYLRMNAQHQISHHKSILERIRNRVYDFLSQTEKQIIYGQIHSDIFEQNRQHVELRLGQICPEALSKFVAAYRRSKENDPESWAQALTSCRRLLKDLADKLYPPTEEPVIGADGKPRILTDDQFKNRLWQYVFEQTGRSTSSGLLLASVQDLGNRIDRLYELTNKGIHADVSNFEVNQCLIQTYILVGDILRIADKQSAIGMEEKD
jgi:hypothetical protein